MLFSKNFNTDKSYLNFVQDTSSVAAFYLPKYQLQEQEVPLQWTEKIKGEIEKSLKNVNLGSINFNSNEFAQSAASFCSSDYSADYVSTVLGYILKNKKIASNKVIEMFFDCYTPVLNMNIFPMGYSNFGELKNAISNGTVNAVNFIQNFSDGLKAFKNNTLVNNFSERYEELPIDVIQKLEFVYTENNILVRRANYDITESQPINRTDNVIINIVAHIQNKNGDLVKSNNIISKLEQTMSAAKMPVNSAASAIDYRTVNNKTNSNVILRVGKDIFEYCRIIDFKTDIAQSYDDVMLVVKLLYNLYQDSGNAGNNYSQLI